MFDREFFLQLMKKAGDSQASLAKALGLHTSTLKQK